MPVAPDGAGGNGETGASPVLSRNCNLTVQVKKPGRPPELAHRTFVVKGLVQQLWRTEPPYQRRGVFLLHFAGRE